MSVNAFDDMKMFFLKNKQKNSERSNLLPRTKWWDKIFLLVIEIKDSFPFRGDFLACWGWLSRLPWDLFRLAEIADKTISKSAFSRGPNLKADSKKSQQI